MPGHLFVYRGDLTRLACDAVLIPSDSTLVVAEWCRPFVPIDAQSKAYRGRFQIKREVPEAWGANDRPLPLVGAGRPTSWLVATGFRNNTPERVASRVVAALRAIESGRPDSLAVPGPGENSYQGRAQPLVALPLVGTGLGGLAERPEEVVEAVIREVTAALADLEMDAVLVCATEEHHSMVQRRRAHAEWPVLDSESEQLRAQLVRYALEGTLVPFLGAGTGVPIGLPLWAELIQKMAAAAGRTDALQLEKMSPLDAAQVLKRSLGENYKPFMQALFRVEKHALAHGLVASLKPTRVFTTNYDHAFELAVQGQALAARQPAQDQRVLCPVEHRGSGGQLVVKLHGDIERFEGLVLTRNEYLDLEGQRRALESLLQASMITDHVLIVGYSLVDDDFVRLARDTKRALEHARPGTPQFGTVLALFDGDASHDLWRGEVGWVGAMPAGSNVAEAARAIEIFLDRLLHEVTLQRS